MNTHIIIIDGTLSTLKDGHETHCGKLFKHLKEHKPANTNIYYDEGVQGEGLFKWFHVAAGTGINHAVIKNYRHISQKYQQGDRIFLFGYSRGAYAVRLLAGLINTLGVLRTEYASLRNAREALTTMDMGVQNTILNFKKNYTISNIAVEFIGVWDTVKALGLPYPILQRFSPAVVDFKDNIVPRNIKHAYHALARDEERYSFRPLIWSAHWPETYLEQMIFKGEHAIIGGQLEPEHPSIPLSHYSYEWIVKAAIKAGLEIDPQWQDVLFPDKNTPFKLDKKIWQKWLLRQKKRLFLPEEMFNWFDYDER